MSIVISLFPRSASLYAYACVCEKCSELSESVVIHVLRTSKALRNVNGYRVVLVRMMRASLVLPVADFLIGAGNLDFLLLIVVAALNHLRQPPPLPCKMLFCFAIEMRHGRVCLERLYTIFQIRIVRVFSLEKSFFLVSRVFRLFHWRKHHRQLSKST